MSETKVSEYWQDGDTAADAYANYVRKVSKQRAVDKAPDVGFKNHLEAIRQRHVEAIKNNGGSGDDNSPKVEQIKLAGVAEINAHINRIFAQNCKVPFDIEATDYYNLVATYAIKDPDFLKNEKGLILNRPSFEKGFALVGSYGVGKTLLLRCLRQMDKSTGFYINGGYARFMTANRIVIEYEGTEYSHREQVFDRYTRVPCLFIDECGNEPLVKRLGKESMIIGQIILERQSMGKMTHITTNKTPEQLGEIYGHAFPDKTKEIFNFVLWEGESKRN